MRGYVNFFSSTHAAFVIRVNAVPETDGTQAIQKVRLLEWPVVEDVSILSLFTRFG